MKVLVTGIGNPDRGDDGVGAAVVRALAGRLPPRVRLQTRRGDLLSLIDDCAGVDHLICVDAAAPAGRPGHVHRFDLATQALPRDLSFMSSHALGLPEAIELARTLGLAPPEIVVYAVEGRGFDDGAPLSAEVAAAVPVLAEHIAAELASDRSAASAGESRHA